MRIGKKALGEVWVVRVCGEGEVSGDKFVVLGPRLLNITQRRLAAARAKREMFIPGCYPEVAGRP
jgi:hypothetical protein